MLVATIWDTNGKPLAERLILRETSKSGRQSQGRRKTVHARRQGWRRFAYVDPTKLIAEHGDDARRAVALAMATEWGRKTLARPGAAGRLDDLFGAVPVDEEVEDAPRPELALRLVRHVNARSGPG